MYIIKTIKQIKDFLMKNLFLQPKIMNQCKYMENHASFCVVSVCVAFLQLVLVIQTGVLAYQFSIENALEDQWPFGNIYGK